MTRAYCSQHWKAASTALRTTYDLLSHVRMGSSLRRPRAQSDVMSSTCLCRSEGQWWLCEVYGVVLCEVYGVVSCEVHGVVLCEVDGVALCEVHGVVLRLTLAGIVHCPVASGYGAHWWEGCLRSRW